MGSDAKNLMSDGNVQIVKTGEVIGATQLTEGELIVEAGGSTVTMARYRSATVPLPQILFSPREAQLVSLRSLRLMAAIPKVNSALIRVMPAVCCWKMAVTCVYWKDIARKKSFSIKRAACWLMGQPQRSW